MLNAETLINAQCSILKTQKEALISPQLDVSTPMWVTFYYKHFYGTYFDGSKEVTGELPAGFIVGFSTKTKNLSDFQWGTSTMGTTVEWNNLTCYCPEGTKYVAVKWQGGYDIYLDDIYKLSDAILYMYKYHGDYDREQIAADCQKRFSSEAIGKQLEGIFEEVIRKRKKE